MTTLIDSILRAKFFALSISAVVVLSLVSSCDPHKPPHIQFKTGAGYTSENATVAQGTSIKVGIIGEKVEDDMKTYNISYAFDGASSTTTKETFKLAASEEKHYEKDYQFTVRSQPGTEIWYFVITDRDGNIAKLSLTLTVN